jgi:hypothetical protein
MLCSTNSKKIAPCGTMPKMLVMFVVLDKFHLFGFAPCHIVPKMLVMHVVLDKFHLFGSSMPNSANNASHVWCAQTPPQYIHNPNTIFVKVKQQGNF